MLGAILGAVLRYVAVLYLPFPILAVNVLGSFLVGLVYPKLTDNFPQYIPLINIGFLGSFTTFSSFSLEIVHGFSSGLVLKTLVYGAFSVIACILVCYLGVKVSNLVLL